jgi:hypothetical protein
MLDERSSPPLDHAAATPSGEDDDYFEIQGFDGFRKRGAAGNSKSEYRVVWAPRVLAADTRFPELLPEVIGLPWDRSDKDWLPASEFRGAKYMNDPIMGPLLRLLKSGGVVGGGIGVEGLG